jgi:hypothetical protein
MNRLAVIYHSAQGHTGHIAGQVVDGARCVLDTEIELWKAEDMAKAPDQLGWLSFGRASVSVSAIVMEPPTTASAAEVSVPWRGAGRSRC